MPTRLLPAAAAIRTALGGLGALLALAACADSATSPTAAARLAAVQLDKAPAAGCDAAPVQALTVTPATLTIVAGQSATFTACTQHATDFTVTSTPAGVATVKAAGPAGRAADGLPYKQAFTVTAAVGAAGRTATITVTDKKGATRAVTVTVEGLPITFSYTGGPQTFTPTATGRYLITADGAAGGTADFSVGGPGSYGPGGAGARASGTFLLTAGQKYTIFVGGQGANGTFGALGGGGGGGTFVVGPNSTLLLAAGGGGGASDGWQAPGEGRGVVANDPGTGGTSTDLYHPGGGGGGWNSGGSTSILQNSGGGGGGYAQAGSDGGTCCAPGGSAPFGGGGGGGSGGGPGGYGGGGGAGGPYGAGGGGGYSGGNGSSDTGQGGTSYDRAADAVVTPGANAGPGSVTVKLTAVTAP